MKRKIFLATITTILLSVFTALPASAATFTDLTEDHPNYEAIMFLQEIGVVSGYPDGSFKPDQTVNRVEAIKMIFAAIEVADPTGNVILDFTDIVPGEWYMTYLQKAVASGIVDGYPDGTFKPGQTVNLVENLKMMLLAAGVQLPSNVTQPPFADTPIGQWYTNYVQYAKDKNIIEPDAQNMVHPDQGMSRATLAETIFRFIVIQENSLDSYSEEDLEKIEEGDTLNELPPIDATIEDFTFGPQKVWTVQKGRTIIWTNLDDADHTVTSDDGIFDSGVLSTDETFSYTFDKIGTFPFHCSIHPEMTGTVVVKEPHQIPTI